MDANFQRMNSIPDNYHCVVDRIYNVAIRAGRKPEDIRLVVVTKTQPVEVIQAVIDAGARDLGENYVEEAMPKIQRFVSNQDLCWHMIGHIQSRKADKVCEHFNFVHSLDSVKLAERLERFCTQLNRSMPIWMEFNTSGEVSKSGWNISQKQNWTSLVQEIEHIFSLPHLNILGGMTIPPYSENPEASRPYFQQLRKFQEYVIGQLHRVDFQGLSIGMSADYEVAIEEGSTCVRIGTAILGPRMG